MLTTTDVLEVTGVALDAGEVKFGVREHALHDPECRVPIDDASSTKTNVDVAQNFEGRREYIGRSRQFIDTVNVINDHVKVAAF